MLLRIVLLLLSSVTLYHLSSGAVSFGTGECPSGHVVGESWSSEGACERCDCQENRFVCFSCGVYSIQLDPNTCYEFRDMTKAYPECCTPVIRCRGDAGFNETFLSHK